MNATRASFRTHAPNNGASPLTRKRLRKALKQLNHCYLDDYMTWLRTNLPATWLFSQNSVIDFEDFRRLISGCRERVCKRLRQHYGFTDLEVARLRIVFVRYCQKDELVNAKGQGALFKSLVPAIDWYQEIRNRMKMAIQLAKCSSSKAISWQNFLLI